MSCFIHADNDSAYCNMVLAFEEDKRNGYAIVLSNNDGCVIAATRKVKDLGIAVCDPYFKVKDICEKNNVHVFSTNFNLIMDMSQRVKHVIGRYVPTVQHYSVDEVFGDITGVSSNPVKYCRDIKYSIEKETKIPTSIGIGPTKSLCKIATHFAKRDPESYGVISLMESHERTKALAKLRIEKVWGIGKKRALKLRLMGIKTALDFRDYDNEYRIQKILTKVGRQIQDELRGHVCFPISNIHEKKKEVMSSRTLSKAVFDKKSVKESIATHAHEIAQELRMSGLVCKSLRVFITTDRYEDGPQYQNSSSRTFQTATNNTFKLIEASLEGLEDIFKLGFLYRKTGVLVTSLQDISEYDLGLFENNNELFDPLMSVMDQVNLTQGSLTLRSLACGTDNFTWRFKQHFRVPSYTTNWEEIPICR